MLYPRLDYIEFWVLIYTCYTSGDFLRMQKTGDRTRKKLRCTVFPDVSEGHTTHYQDASRVSTRSDDDSNQLFFRRRRRKFIQCDSPYLYCRGSYTGNRLGRSTRKFIGPLRRIHQPPTRSDSAHKYNSERYELSV